MTLSVPSCFAAATSASIPPLAAALVAVAQALPAGWPAATAAPAAAAAHAAGGGEGEQTPRRRR